METEFRGPFVACRSYPGREVQWKAVGWIAAFAKVVVDGSTCLRASISGWLWSGGHVCSFSVELAPIRVNRDRHYGRQMRLSS